MDIRGNAGLGDTIPTANGPFDLTHFSIRWHLAEGFSSMRFRLLLLVFCLSQLAASSTKRIPVNKLLDQMIRRSTLVQPGGQPFYLKATITDRDDEKSEFNGPDFCKDIALGFSTTFNDLFAKAAAGTPDPNWDFEPDTVTIKKGTPLIVVDRAANPIPSQVNQFVAALSTA